MVKRSVESYLENYCVSCLVMKDTHLIPGQLQCMAVGQIQNGNGMEKMILGYPLAQVRKAYFELFFRVMCYLHLR